MEIELQGLRICCLDEGRPDDTLVVLLHGWGCEIDTYRSIVDTVKTKYRIVVPQLPGFGKSDPPPRGWSMRDYTELVLEFINGFHAQRVILIGHSFGTRIMIRLATQYALPFAIEKMVFEDGAGILPQKLPEYLEGFRHFQEQKKTLMAGKRYFITFWEPVWGALGSAGGLALLVSQLCSSEVPPASRGRMA